MVSLIVATDRNYGIGFNGEMAWHIPFELKKFRSIIGNSTAIVGRRTYSKLPRLSKMNISVLSRKDVVLKSNNHSYLKSTEGLQDFFVIGGRNVYLQFIKKADVIYHSIIYGNYECDCYLNELSFLNDFQYELLEKNKYFETRKYNLKGVK